MKKMAVKIPHFFKKHKVISITALITVIVLGWWGIVNYMPHPLGDKLTYLGKRDFGCWIGVCDSDPAAIYYYGTKMTAKDVVDYFKKSKLLQPAFLENGKTTFKIQTPDGQIAYIYFYSSSELDLFKTKLPYVIEIPSFKYNSLGNSM